MRNISTIIDPKPKLGCFFENKINSREFNSTLIQIRPKWNLLFWFRELFPRFLEKNREITVVVYIVHMTSINFTKKISFKSILTSKTEIVSNRIYEHIFLFCVSGSWWLFCALLSAFYTNINKVWKELLLFNRMRLLSLSSLNVRDIHLCRFLQLSQDRFRPFFTIQLQCDCSITNTLPRCRPITLFKRHPSESYFVCRLLHRKKLWV